MWVSGLVRAFARVWVGLFLVSAAFSAFAGPALAISADCNALKGQSFSYTGTGPTTNPFNQTLNGGATYTLDPGEILSFNVSVPAGGSLTITFGGQSVTVDNTSGTSTLNQTVSITVPDSGGSVTSTIRFSGSVNGTTTVSADIDCNESTSSSASGDIGGQIDRVIQSTVPGGSNGGDLFAAFGVPAPPRNPCDELQRQVSQLLTEVLSAEGDVIANGHLIDGDVDPADRAEFNRIAARAENLRAEFERLRETLKKECEDVGSASNTDSGSQEPVSGVDDGNANGGGDDDCDEKQAAVEAARQKVGQRRRELEQAKINLARKDEIAAEIGELEDAIRGFNEELAGQEVSEVELGVLRTLSAGLREERAKLADFQRRQGEFQLRHDQAIRFLGDAERELERAEAAARDCMSGSNASNYASASSKAATPAVSAIGGFAGNAPGNPVRDTFAALKSFTARDNSVSGSFDLAHARAYAAANGNAYEGLLGDERFNAWINGGVTLHFDNEAGFGQDGSTVTVSGGVSYRIRRNVDVGLAGYFGHTDRNGATGSTKADTWSLGVFTRMRLPQDTLLSAMLAYSLVGADASFNQGGGTVTGNADATSLAGQVELSRTFRVKRWRVSPSLGASVVNIDRDAFTDSSGTPIAGSNSTRVTLLGGIEAATTRVIEGADGETILISPSFGLKAYANLGRFDPLVGATGITITDDSFGLAASAGMGVTLGKSGSLSFSSSLAGLFNNQKNLSLSARYNRPF